MADVTYSHEDLENTHPDYDEHVDEWVTIDDLCRGPRCVKERGTKYLDKLADQENSEYQKYKKRAKFFNATKRTREALTGMMLRKKPDVEAGSINQVQFADVTLTGLDIEDYSRQVASAVVSKGRAGTFIDWSEDERQPYLSFYKAEDVLNWATARIDGKEVLVMLVLREHEDFVEEFDVSRRKRIRRYWLPTENLGDADESDDKVAPGLMCETYIESDDEGKSFEQETEATPVQRRGITLDRIPFVFHNSGHLGASVGEAPLYDIAELNVKHYQTSADLENGRHFCGLPFVFGKGIDDDAKELYVGSEKAWLTDNAEADVKWVEFTGQGLDSLVTANEETEKQMAMLGARLLFDQKKDAEAFETHQLRAGSETSALVHIAGTASVTMTEVLQWFDWWDSTLGNPVDSKASFAFTNDFVPTVINPSLLAELLKAYVAGAISFDAFFSNCQKGELYPDDWTLEKELNAIRMANDLPVPGQQNDPNRDPDANDDDPPDE